MMKKALICGISGQDGAYLTQSLLRKGYHVCGTSRDAQITPFTNLKRLGIHEKVQLESMAPTDFRSVIQAIDKTEPDEIYFLAGQSSVGLSFEQPVETLQSITIGTLNILEAVRYIDKPIRIYNACSSECFGDTGDVPASETTLFLPRSPYAVAKAAAFWEVANYREAYGLFACSGILFNHESPLRPARFVTQKIISYACDVLSGNANISKKLRIGNIEIQRDWGWAPDYVEAMYLMLQQEHPDDYVIATGQSHSLKNFIESFFSFLHLDWRDYVEVDPTLFSPLDLQSSKGDPRKAEEELGWKSNYGMNDVIRMMMEAASGKN